MIVHHLGLSASLTRTPGIPAHAAWNKRVRVRLAAIAPHRRCRSDGNGRTVKAPAPCGCCVHVVRVCLGDGRRSWSPPPVVQWRGRGGEGSEGGGGKKREREGEGEGEGERGREGLRVPSVLCLGLIVSNSSSCSFYNVCVCVCVCVCGGGGGGPGGCQWGKLWIMAGAWTMWRMLWAV